MIPNGIKVVGSIEPSIQPLRVHLSKASGNTYQLSFHGLASEVWIKFYALARTAAEADFDQPPGSASATATLTFQRNPLDNSTEESQDTLELDWFEVTGSIFNNPTYAYNASTGAGIAPGRIAVMEGLRDFCKSLDPSGNPRTDSDITDAINENLRTAEEKAAFQLVLRGVESYPWEVPVLTLTRTVSASFPTPMIVATAGQIFSVGQVSTYLGNLAVLFAIPQLANNVAAPGGFSLGWKKKVRATLMANGCWNLVEQFTYGAWADDLYGKAQGFTALATS